MRVWWNWYTQDTQNVPRKHGGSSPSTRTKTKAGMMKIKLDFGDQPARMRESIQEEMEVWERSITKKQKIFSRPLTFQAPCDINRDTSSKK